MRASMLLSLLLLLCGAHIYLVPALLSRPALTLSVLPVTGGDALLLTAPSGQTFLIDTGTDASILRALGESLPPWQRHIDAILLTSPRLSASGGIQEVLARYRVGEVLRPREKGSARMESALAQTGVRQVQLERGMRLVLGRVAVDVLSPAQKPSVDDAVVVRISYGATSFLVDERINSAATLPGAAGTNLAFTASSTAGVYISDGMRVKTKTAAPAAVFR